MVEIGPIPVKDMRADALHVCPGVLPARPPGQKRAQRKETIAE